MVYQNSAGINVSGIVIADGLGGFTGQSPLGVTNGGTGTSTQFTLGSVVFAGASGIYAQDNANFFWDNTNNRLGIGTSTPASSIDCGSITIGSYAGTNAAPTNGMIVSGQVGISTNSVGANNQLQINPNVAHGVSVMGTMTAVDNGNNQHAYNSTQTFAPTAGATICSSFEGTPTLAIPVGQTVTSAVTFRSSPSFTNNLGTITTKYGFWFDGGGSLPGGTLTTSYGAYFATPVAGTTKIPLYADGAAIGTSGTAPPTNGLLVNGNIRNSALSANAVTYTNATKDITSVALTNGQVLIGATGAAPAAATLTAGSGVSITNAANSITISASASFVSYTAITNASSPYTVLSTDQYISVNSSGGAVTINCPNTTTTGRIIIIKDRLGNAATNNITVTTPGGTVTIDGSTSYVMNVNRQSINLIFNGTNYEVF
jgi:hypothetical protein